MRWLGLTLASSILLPLALPNELFPSGQPLLGMVALVPLFLAYRGAKSYTRSIHIATVFAVVSTFLANYWLMFFGEFSVWTISGVIAGYVLFGLLLGPILHWTSRTGPRWRPFLIALVWTGYEYLTSVGYLGYPWGLVAYPVSDISPLVQHVDITGIWSLSFLMASANSVLAEVGRKWFSPRLRWLRVRQVGVVALLFAAALVYGWLRLATPIPTPESIDMVLVQQNTDSWAVGGHERALRTAQQLTREGIAAKEASPDLVAWSETSLRRPYRESRRYYETYPDGDPFVEFLSDIGTPLLTGNTYVLDLKEQEYLNAAILLRPSGELVDYYGKQHPVPFAEHVPFWDVAAVRRFFREVIGLQAIWVTGSEYTVFEVENASGDIVRLGTPICFEDSFGYIGRGFVRRGAEVLVNLTNNSWSRTESAQIQHFVAARFRAIENRRTLVRSTNSGLTAVVDAYGRTIAQLPMFEEAQLRVTVPIYKAARLTPYTVLGDYVAYLTLALLFSVAVASALRPRRHKKLGPATEGVL